MSSSALCWVVLVGPGSSCRPLISTWIAADAVKALDALGEHAPSLRVCVCVYMNGACQRVLVREGGLTTIEAPELFQALANAPDGGSPSTGDAASQPADLSVEVV